jgi:tetratricopeptide (TPR) repeat protein
VAGDKKAFEESINEGLSFAWDGEWEKARVAFERARTERPDDPEVHRHLGLALFELGQLDQALEAYTLASRLAPLDPVLLERIAACHELLGQRHAAADALFSLAKLHREQNNWTNAIEALKRVIHLHDGHLRARFALAEIYAEQGHSQRAISEYMGLARTYEARGQTEKALDQCRQALHLDVRHAEARALFEALQRGESVAEIGVVPEPRAGGASPADLAREEALQELASIPFDDASFEAGAEPGGPESMVAPALAGVDVSPDRRQIEALVADGVDYQSRGLVEDAIACYTQAIEAGMDRAAVHYCLGLLYQQRSRFKEAIAALLNAIHSPEYGLGSRFALGECYQAVGLLDDAANQFIEVIKSIDLSLARKEDTATLVRLYDVLADSYVAKGDRDRALEFVAAVIEFLSAPDWKDRAREARERLDGMADDGEALSLADVLVVPGSDAVVKALTKSREYADRGASTAAIEICYEALETAPTYLPLHLRLAEIFAQSGAVEDAISKYQMVAELHLAQEEPNQAIAVYQRMLRLRPLDIIIRSHLIDLLTSSGEIDQAMEEYVALADAYYDLAQVDKALETAGEALRLAPRATETKAWRLRCLRVMTDYEMRRANWRQAAELFHQMVSFAPEDERARLGLIDVNFKLGRVKEADRETMALIEYYREMGEPGRVLALLTEAVRMQPNEVPLRARLAQAYVDAGLREEAVRQLDALGELQLDAGRRKEAMATVRYIISLEPKDVDAYRQLLAQL